jgi:hypothetical protein
MLQNIRVQELPDSFRHVTRAGRGTWAAQVFGQLVEALHHVICLQLEEESVLAEQGFLLNKPSSQFGPMTGYTASKKIRYA